MLRPIYEPRTRAREYCDLAVNIYTGCPHGCTYCYARAMAKRFSGRKYVFKFDTPEPRPGIVEAVKRQLVGMQGQSKKIMLCFTCDPYPLWSDSTATREVIQAIKESGNHVQILTKGGSVAQRDFDLLDANDFFGVSWTGGEICEPFAAPHKIRRAHLIAAKDRGISTWISCEPVIVPAEICRAIKDFDFVDMFYIGRLNNRKISINWPAFGRKVEALCIEHGRNYYIKAGLRAEMEKL
jgi:DNA repair photolyase